jgi:hypothetical protein
MSAELRSWATYGGVFLGLLGTAVIVAAFAWPLSWRGHGASTGLLTIKRALSVAEECTRFGSDE